MPIFDKILIANRGEIACRIIKTARRMGIATVAIYSDADRDGRHVRMADEAVRVGPAPSADSYLQRDRIVAAAQESGAQAVHPGFGFLAENPAFAEALEAAGIAFIGPPKDAIAAMGDKIQSKKLAIEAGVNTVPGHTEAVTDPDDAVAIAAEIGLPVMLKASAGGGGKGMRIAWTEDEVREGLKSAASEARSAFGDERVFVEKFIERPHHIEIQVLADSHGNTVYLGERECSIQRRHQKVIEEAPSPFIDPQTRQAMGEQAVALARAVGYTSAGTVELIVDKDKNFFFLEMNTRLQVEHPVTELITGLDLVELMIRVAAGETLPFGQADVRLKGWALEARIYAEDAARNFMPSIGRLSACQPPAESESVRVDTGVEEGSEISMHYDPMIAKLVTWGSDREEAIRRMLDALDAYYIEGVQHNIAFLAAVMRRPAFLAGDLTTGFIAEHFPEGFDPGQVALEDPALLVAIAAALQRRLDEREASISGQAGGLRRPSEHWVAVMPDRSEHRIRVDAAEDHLEVIVDGETYRIASAWRPGLALFHGTVKGRNVIAQVRREGIGWWLQHRGRREFVRVLSPRAAELLRLMPLREAPDMSRFLLSPMPGLLLSLAVAEGEEVKTGQELAVVEAMKMENVLRAERDGTVKALLAGPGDSLEVDQAIIELE